MKENLANKRLVLIITVFLFVLLVAVLALPAVKNAVASQVTYNQSDFDVVFIQENANCTFTTGQVQLTSATPTEAGTTTAQVIFNISDNNGWDDIDGNGCSANVTKGAAARTSSACSTASTSNALIAKVTCNISMYYYDEPGTWNVGVAGSDQASGTNPCTGTGTNNFTYSTLHAFRIKTQNSNNQVLSFTGLPNAKALSNDNPLNVNNTGNGLYARFNVTAFDLSNVNDRTNVLGAGNFSFTTDNYATNTSFTGNNTWKYVLNESADGNKTLARTTTFDVNFSMSVPTGLINGTYNTTNRWLIDGWA